MEKVLCLHCAGDGEHSVVYGDNDDGSVTCPTCGGDGYIAHDNEVPGYLGCPRCGECPDKEYTGDGHHECHFCECVYFHSNGTNKLETI